MAEIIKIIPMRNTDGQIFIAGRLAPELFVWLSPAFPTGAFAYSQGLEAAVALGWISDGAYLQDWASASVTDGAIGNDLMLASLSMRAESGDELRELGALSMALLSGAERHKEAAEIAFNFRNSICAGWPHLGKTFAVFDEFAVTLPVMLGAVSRVRGIDSSSLLLAYGHSAVGHVLSAAIRLSVIGQVSAQQIHAELFPVIEGAVQRALRCDANDLGSATLVADIASLMHETQKVRLFRS